MAAKPTTRRPLSTLSSFSCFVPFLCLVSLLLFALFFSAARPSVVSRYDDLLGEPTRDKNRRPCNYSDGAWVLDPDPVALRYDHTCQEIFKGWNCIASGKLNGRDLLRWRWQPSRCSLPRLDPLRFLRRFRNTNIGWLLMAIWHMIFVLSFAKVISLGRPVAGFISAGFVGDSLSRNMYVSLVCMLRSVSRGVRKWRPAGADRGFTFLDYNLTVAYHRTNLLVRYGRWSASDNGGALESLGIKQGYRVDVDVPEHTWAEAPSFHHILIFNTGHWWWAPSKFDPEQSPMLFFEKGLPVLPPVPPEIGIDLALKHMISYAERRAAKGARTFFRTQSPRHFEGGDWNRGGSCRRREPLLSHEVEELFSVEKNATNAEVRVINQHLHKALRRSSFQILDITRMSEFRADAHPSTTGRKKHEDCMHWCLPGLTDTWNDVLMAALEDSTG